VSEPAWVLGGLADVAIIVLAVWLAAIAVDRWCLGWRR
jgi:hypothetical protein